MISHAKISQHRRMFKTLTGLSTEGFKQILPSFEKVWKDTGFQGYEPAGVTTLQAKKKPKGGKLSPEEKEANRPVSTEKLRAGSRTYLR
jgi:hypothetical protein